MCYTFRYQVSEEEESQETALEREISSAQPQYSSVVRTRSTTLPPLEEPSTPEPTTILSVQISSLLNEASSEDVENPRPEPVSTQITELPEPDTTTTSTTTIATTPTTTTTFTTPPPTKLSTRAPLLRRRGSTTTTTTAAPISSTQVSSRNYSFIRRRRPLSQPNEISESNESIENVRNIRSTTPDSREVNGVKVNGDSGLVRRFRIRSRTQTTRSGDSIPAAATQVSRGQFRPRLSRDELLSLTPIDVDSSEIVENDEVVLKNNVNISNRVFTTVADKADDSEISAATIDERRSSISPRGRSRYPSLTTQAIGTSVATEAPLNQRRPTFTRFTPRPFARTVSTTSPPENNLENESIPVSQRPRSRFSFARSRTQSSTPLPSPSPVFQARKLPFPSRQLTARPKVIPQNDDEEEDNKNDDINLSETAIEEKEHDGTEDEELQKKPNASEDRLETIPIDESNADKNGRRKFRVIRRRPTPSTSEAYVANTEGTTAIPRIRKIIRKKLKPVEEDEIAAKTSAVINAGFKEPPNNVINYGEKTRTTTFSIPPTDDYKTTTEINEGLEDSTEILKEIVTKSSSAKEVETVKQKDDENNTDGEKAKSVTSEVLDVSEEKPEVVVKTEAMNIDLSDNKETTIQDEKSNDSKSAAELVSDREGVLTSVDNNNETSQKSEIVSENLITTESNALEIVKEDTQTTELSGTEIEMKVETTTTSTTQLTSPSPRSRSPYRPSKRLFTSTTESTPSSSRTFSRKFNPGAYTSPATVERPGFISRVTTKRPLFSRTFTRRTFPTVRTTPKAQIQDEEEYSDEEILEEEPENPFVFVPQTQLFTRKPNSEEYEDDQEEEEELENEDVGDDDKEILEEENYEDEEQPVTLKSSSKRPQFKPKVINSNTFRTSTSTTEIPRRLFGSNRNKTISTSRFGGNNFVNDTKKRVQNVPLGYTAKPIQSINSKNATIQLLKTTNPVKIETKSTPVNQVNDQTTTESDDYLSMEETNTSVPSETDNSSDDASTLPDTEKETVTTLMEIDNSTDDYLEFTTSYPSTHNVDLTQQIDSETVTETLADLMTTKKVENVFEITTKEPEATTSIPPVSPIVKTQFNKLFSISRVVEVSSKSEKHRLNKNNETTLIEEGKVMVEKKPTVDKIGEVSRFSLIKIVEDEIPIYLTKLGHVYPVDNPPNNPIRIDEARNARALVDYFDVPREHLLASESMNEAYRHISKVSSSGTKHQDKENVEHILSDDFLSYVNDDKKTEKLEDDQSFNTHWQFIPAAYENEQLKLIKSAKSFEVVTPHLMLTDPSTLPVEALFQTENPIQKVKKEPNDKEPFVVYSAPVPTQEEDANLVKIKILKPQTSRSIVTSAKGKEFQGSSIVEEPTIITPIKITILKDSHKFMAIDSMNTSSKPTSISTTTISQTTSVRTEAITTSPIMELLTTIQANSGNNLKKDSEISRPTLITEAEPVTTETVLEETTTPKMSPLDTKRAKYGLPRRLIKPSNYTRINSIPRTTPKINITPRILQRNNKTTGFNSNASRFSANRAQNIPVDIRKKTATPKSITKVSKTYTTEAPRSTTERKSFVKPIRPLRPSFVPKRFTTQTPTVVGDT